MGRDAGVVIFFLLVPLVYPVIYAFIYHNEVVHEAKLLVVDQSNSALSRDFTRRVDATPDVQVVALCPDMEEARRRMDAKEGYGILVFPPEFSHNLHQGQQTQVSLYCDMSALLFYKAFLLSATEVSLNMASTLQARNHPASTDKLQEIAVMPVPYESVAMFNTPNGFASFLVPAILILVLQQTLVLGIGLLGGTLREKNIYHRFASDARGPLGTLPVVLGKVMAYLSVYALVSFWVIGVVPRLFGLPQVGQVWDVVCFLLPYLLACICFALTLSCLITSREQPMMLFVFMSVILLFISGVSWPKESIPPFWQALGYLFPSTPGIQGFIRINTSGATLHQVVPEFITLWVQTVVYFITACVLFRYRITHGTNTAF